MADGSLKFDTRVDTSGMKKDLQSVGTVAKGVFTADIIEKFAAEAGQAIAGLAKNMVEVGAAFESSMSQVAATMGITTEEIAAGSSDFEKLSAAAKEMGASTKYTAAEAAEGLNILAMAGLTADEAISTLPSVLSLAAAGAMDMSTAASYVTGAVKGYADSMENAGMYADIMAKGATMANTDVNALGAALSGSAASANAYGQSVDTAAIALLRLAEQNVTGQEAATAMNRAMADLYTPTANGAKALKELGVSMYDVNGDARDFNDVVDELNGALEGMSMEQRLAYENTIFTTYGMKAFQKMTVSTSEKVEEFAEGIRNASGSAMKQMETQIDNLEGKLTILNSATEAVGIEFYEIFEETMKDAVDHATDAMTNFQRAMQSGRLKESLQRLSEAVADFSDKTIEAAEDILPKMIDGLAWMIDNSSTIKSGVLGIVSAVVAYRVATEGAAVAQAALNMVMNANPYILLGTVVAGLAVSLGSLAVSCGTVETAADVANQKLNEMTSGATEALENLNKIGDETRTTFEGLDTTANHMEAMKDRLLALNKIEELSTTQKAEMAAITQELNAYLGEEAITLDDEGHILGDNTDAWEKNLEAKIQAAKADAAQEKMTELYKAQTEAALELAIAEDNIAKIRAERSQKQAKLNELETRFGNLTVEESELYYKLQSEIEALNLEEQGLLDTQKDLNEANSQAQGQIDTLTEYLEKEGEACDETGGHLEDLQETTEGVVESTIEMSEEMQDAYDSLTKAVGNSIESQTGLFDDYNSATEATFENIKKRLTDQIDAMQNWSTNIKTLAERGIDQGLLYELETMGPEGAAYVQQFVNMTGDELNEISTLYAEKAAIDEQTKTEVAGAWAEAATTNVTAYTEGATAASDQATQVGQAVVDKSLEGLVNSPTWNALTEEAKQRIIDASNQAKEGAEEAKKIGEAIPDQVLEGMVGAATWASLPETVQDQIRTANAAGTTEGEKGAKETGEAITGSEAESIEAGSNEVIAAAETTTQAAIDKMNEVAGTQNGTSSEGQKIGEGIDKGIAEGMKLMISLVEAAAETVSSSIITRLKGALDSSNFYSIGTNIDAGLNQGMLDGLDELRATAKLVGDTVAEATQESVEVNSPSRRFKWIGEMCVAGLEQGLEPITNGNTIGSAASMVGDIRSSVSTPTASQQITNSVNVTLEGDAQRLFSVVRQESNKFTKTTGINAFA